jgi:acyl carrier protein
MTETTYVELVRQAMSELLETPEIAEDVNFFSAGGDSMMAIRLTWRLSKATGIELHPAEDVMDDPTPSAIARRLAEKSQAAALG